MEDKKFSENMIVIKLSGNKPPVFKEVTGKDWVYYGAKNDYPYYIIDLYNKSSKHNAIVNAKAQYIAGAGWGDIGETTIVNSEGETLNDITRKVAIDFELFGGFPIEVIWNKAKTRIAELRHIDFSNIRTNKENDLYYYTSEWLTKRGFINHDPLSAEDWTEYSPFNPNSKEGTQLFYFKSYRPGINIYPLPQYLAAISYIELDFQVANYWYNRVKYGFTASCMINFFNGVPTQEEMDKIESRINAKFAGTDNAGNFILNFSDGKDRGAEVQQMSSPELSQEYESLNKTVQQEIFAGHSVTSPMLMGIKTEGQLGGRTELIEQSELFQNTYITPKQKILESAFKILFKNMGIEEKMELKKTEPIGYMFSENIISNVLPREAIRDMVADKLGIDLTKYATPVVADPNQPTTTTPPTPVQTSSEVIKKKESNLLRSLLASGHKNMGKILSSRPVSYEMAKNLKMSEQEFVSMSKHTFLPTIKGSTLERSIIDLLSKDPLMPADGIAKVVGKDVAIVEHTIKDLITKGALVDVSNKGEAPSLQVQPKADKIIEDNPAPTERIFVKYSYDWIPGFSDSDLDKSREFCVDLRNQTNQGYMWYRENIENLNNGTNDEMVSSVFESRGGWYTKPNTDIHVPHCRHQWMQHIILENE